MTLERDCDCVTHTNPHWLHMNDFDWSANLNLLEKAVSMVASKHVDYIEAFMRRFCELEARRLQEKAHYMTLYGIERIPLEFHRKDLEEREHSLLEQMLSEIEKVKGIAASR